MERINELHPLATRSGDFADAQRCNIDRRGARAGEVIGSLVATIGALLTGGGLWALMVGGSAYYILLGVGYVASGVLLWQRRTAGAWVAVALFAATVAWALREVGLNYWALYPRMLPPAGLAFLAVLATLRFPANKSWRVAAHTAGVLGLLIGIQFAFAFVPHGAMHRPPSHHVALCSIAKSNDC